MSTTLPLFWHLSSASQKDRIDASIKLVGALEQFQSQFLPKGSPESSDEEDDEEEGSKTDGLDILNSQDVSYSIRRLIRGLASPRESSRLGFAVALTELLSRINTVSCSQIVAIIIDLSKTQGSMTGQEERDVLFARLFGLTAIIQSGLLVRLTPLPSSVSSSSIPSSLAGYQEVLSQLIALGEKKSFLRESAWWTMGLAIDELNSSKVAWKEEAVEFTVQSVLVDHAVWTPEKVAITLKFQNAYPKRDWSILSPTFKNTVLLSSVNLLTLARILKESNLENEEGPKSSPGNWKPQVHFVWDVILDQLLSSSKSAHPTTAPFQEFFRVVVDESLFSSTSSAERKYWGFQVFQKALPRVAGDDMPKLFTKNFMRTWINHLSKNDRYLHKAAKQVATDIQAFVDKNPTLGFTLILQLTGTNGNRQFDKLTKTKTVESILASMDTAGVETYISYLLKQVDTEEGEKDDIAALNARRAWIIDQFGALIRNTSIPKSDQWIQLILDWLVLNGLFVIKKKSGKSSFFGLQHVPSPSFSDDLRKRCRTRLLNSLADLTGQVTLVKLDGDKMQKEPGVASDGQFWISRVLVTIETLTKDTKHVELIQELDDDDQAVVLKAKKLSGTLQKVAADQRDSAKGADLLLSAMVLQQYSLAEEEDIDSYALETCVEATTDMFASKKRSGPRRSSIDGDAEEDAEPVDVLVDSIIGMLEQSTAYLRTVANQVFSLLSGSVKGTTIDLILRQLEPRNPAELAADEDEGMDDLEDEQVSPSSEEDEEDSGDELSASDPDTDNDEEGEDIQELRRKIEEALEVNGIEAATGDSDEDSDEELMDDDQMMAIDEQLADVFRARANENKTSKDVDAQREATHFKNRVIDLVDIFVKKQPSSPHTVRLILPLLDLIAGTGVDEKQMSDKATGLLRNRIAKLKDVPSTIDTEVASTILDELHRRARKARTPDFLSTLNQCSLYMARVLLHAGAEDLVVGTYRESLMDFASRKASNLNVVFIQDFIRRNSVPGWRLREDVLSASNKAANVYRQCQSFQLLGVLLNQIPALGEREKEVMSFMPKCRQALQDFATQACSDERVVATAAQIKDVLKLGLLAIRQTQRVTSSSDSLEEIWKPSVWETLHRKFASSERFKASTALQTLCQQLAKASRGAPSAKSKGSKKENGTETEVRQVKRKAAVTVNGDDLASTRKAKRKKIQKAKV